MAIRMGFEQFQFRRANSSFNIFLRRNWEGFIAPSRNSSQRKGFARAMTTSLGLERGHFCPRPCPDHATRGQECPRSETLGLEAPWAGRMPAPLFQPQIQQLHEGKL